MDWSNPVSSAISGGFGIIGSALNYHFNKKLAEQQNQYNLEMWNMNNEYNSPQAQMRRYEEAGLNPALLYGNISPGNSSAPPVKSVPQAPDVSKSMRELGQAFNIVGLKEAIANMHRAQAEARRAKADADDAESNNRAQELLQWDYNFDPATGQYIRNTGLERDVYPPVQAQARGKLMRFLQDNYRVNSLLVPRANLIGSQTRLNTERQNLLAPQIRYWNFNTVPWRMNTRFWLGNARIGAQVLTPFIP